MIKSESQSFEQGDSSPPPFHRPPRPVLRALRQPISDVLARGVKQSVMQSDDISRINRSQFIMASIEKPFLTPT